MAVGGVADGLATVLEKAFEPVDRPIEVLASGASQEFIADPTAAWLTLLLVIVILILAVLASAVRIITSLSRNRSEQAAVEAVAKLGGSSPENARGALSVLKRFLERKKS